MVERKKQFVDAGIGIFTGKAHLDSPFKSALGEMYVHAFIDRFAFRPREGSRRRRAPGSKSLNDQQQPRTGAGRDGDCLEPAKGHSDVASAAELMSTVTIATISPKARIDNLRVCC